LAGNNTSTVSPYFNYPMPRAQQYAVPEQEPQPTAEELSEGLHARAAEASEEAGGPEPEPLPFDLDSLETTRAETLVVPESLRGSPAAARAYMTTQPINAQISAATRDIESVRTTSNELLQQRQALSAIQSAVRNNGKKADTRVNLEDITVHTASGQTINAAALLERVGLLEKFEKEGKGKASASINSLEDAAQELRERSEEVNSSTQTTMVQLQELMHQRNLLLQLATSELSSREQIERRIAENIR